MQRTLGRKILRNKKGSAVVICVVLFTSFVFFSGIIIEASAKHAAEVTVETALENAGRSALSCFDKELYDRYGVFALEMSEDELKSMIHESLGASLKDVSMLSADIESIEVDMGAYTLMDTEALKIQITEMMRKTALRETFAAGIEAFENVSESIRKKEDASSQIVKLEKERDEARQSQEESLTEKEDGKGSDNSSAEHECVDFGEIYRVHNMLKNLQKDAEESLNEMNTDIVLRNRNISDNLPSVQAGLKTGSALSDVSDMVSDFLSADIFYVSDSLLIDLYITEMFDDHGSTKGIPDDDSLFSGEMEYIIYGDLSDGENYTRSQRSVFLIRSALNLAYLYSDPEKTALMMETAEALTPGPFALLTQLLISSAWSAAEAANDVANLNHGSGVPVIKNDDTWMTDLDNILSTGSYGGYIEIPVESDMRYREYLKLILMTQPAEKKLYRIMDLYQINMKGSVRKEFTVSDHITGFSLDYMLTKKSRSLSVRDQVIKGHMEHAYILE